MTVEGLLRAGRMERVPPDPAAARRRLEACQQHLTSAELLASSDPARAYAALYDAARKALTAHLLAQGLRASNRAGAHEAIGVYALIEVDDPTGSVRRFQAMRLRRNRSEYQDVPVGVQEVVADLVHARAIVAAVATTLEPSR